MIKKKHKRNYYNLIISFLVNSIFYLKYYYLVQVFCYLIPEIHLNSKKFIDFGIMKNFVENNPI